MRLQVFSVLFPALLSEEEEVKVAEHINHKQKQDGFLFIIFSLSYAKRIERFQNASPPELLYYGR